MANVYSRVSGGLAVSCLHTNPLLFLTLKMFLHLLVWRALFRASVIKVEVPELVI